MYIYIILLIICILLCLFREKLIDKKKLFIVYGFSFLFYGFFFVVLINKLFEMKKLLLLTFLGLSPALIAGNGKPFLIEMSSQSELGSSFTLVVQYSSSLSWSALNRASIRATGGYEVSAPKFGVAPGSFELTVRRGGSNISGEEIQVPEWEGIIIVGIDNITGVKINGNSGVNLTAQYDENSFGSNGIEGGGVNPNPKDEEPEDSGSSSSGPAQATSSNVAPLASSSHGSASKVTKGEVEILPSGSANEFDIVTVGEILLRGVTIHDQSGKQVFPYIESTSSGKHIHIDLSTLRAGLYILMIDLSGSKSITRKIFKS